MTARALLPLLLLCGGADAAAQERSLAIQGFDAAIVVEPGGAIRVTETITVRFNGEWNGLYRSIPVKYRSERGLNWTLGVEIAGATDQDGRALRIETSRERHYLKVKMWVPGARDATRTLVLRYRATNGLRYFEEHDELYWNVTGDEWDVPIGMATARIELPPGVTGVRAAAFTGAYGSTARDARVTVTGATVGFATTRPLGFREGLTAVVGWDKGITAAPTVAARAAGVVASNWPLAIPVPVFLLALAVWRRRGRDPARRPITVRYEPPSGLTPGEAGTLIDHQVDLRDITATLVDLAVRGYLRFEEREEPKLFGLFSTRGYVLHRLEPPAGAAPLAVHETRVLEGVFGGRGAAVKLSELEDEFYTAIPSIKNAVHERLVERGYYHARPDKVRSHWLVGALFAGVVIGGAGGALAAKLLLTPVPFVIAAVASALILAVFALVMPARSVAGARALEAVLGFEEFLTRVESEAYKRVIVGHPEMFDKYLPFAMAFGVERKWAAAFADIYTEAPSWYVGPSVAHFSVGRLSSSLASFTREAGSTLTSSPRSSSGSGFGGGGSSGGGGGGGGGGGF